MRSFLVGGVTYRGALAYAVPGSGLHPFVPQPYFAAGAGVEPEVGQTQMYYGPDYLDPPNPDGPYLGGLTFHDVGGDYVIELLLYSDVADVAAPPTFNAAYDAFRFFSDVTHGFVSVVQGVGGVTLTTRTERSSLVLTWTVPGHSWTEFVPNTNAPFSFTVYSA